MRRLGVGSFCVVVIASYPACSSDSPRPRVSPNDRDGGAPPQASDGGSDAPATSCKQAADVKCTQLLNCGQSIPVIQIQQDPPTPQGGRIDDGLYYMTLYSVYTGANGAKGPIGASFRETIRFNPGVVELASESDKDPLSNFTLTVSYEDATATTPPRMFFDFDCPNTRRLVLPFTVAADKKSFQVHYQANWVATYTRVVE